MTDTGFNFGTPKYADVDCAETELRALSASALEDGTVHLTCSYYERRHLLLSPALQRLGNRNGPARTARDNRSQLPSASR
jgi:hypothetical protein